MDTEREYKQQIRGKPRQLCLLTVASRLSFTRCLARPELPYSVPISARASARSLGLRDGPEGRHPRAITCSAGA